MKSTYSRKQLQEIMEAAEKLVELGVHDWECTLDRVIKICKITLKGRRQRKAQKDY